MPNRDDQILVRVTKEKKREILDASIERDITMSEVVNRSVDFFLGFPPAFLEEIERIAETVKMPIQTVLANLLMVYVAEDKAILDNFGVSKTYEMAFRFRPEGGLIQGDEVSKTTYEEMDKACKEVLKKLKRTSKTGEASFLSKLEASIIPHIYPKRLEV